MKTEKIRHIYSIVIGIFAVAMGIALICVAADIYYGGKSTGVFYTRQNVAARLKTLAIPFFILIGAIACGAVFPLYEVKAKHKSEDSVRLLQCKKPDGGEGDGYAAAEQNYKKFTTARLIVWGCALAVTLACTIAALCYLLNAAHFAGRTTTVITAEIFRMVSHVLPWIAVMFAALIAAAVTNGILAGKQLRALKSLIKLGNGTVTDKPCATTYARVIDALQSNIALWVVRGVIFAVAVTFIILGICNGGAHDVLIKAVNICTECIGLG